MTIQGLIPYYYDVLHPGASVNLDYCIYNQMASTPKQGASDADGGHCRTGEVECEDCRERPLEDIVTTHFTICQKPWHCLPYLFPIIEHRLCRKLVGEWYRIRSDLEKAWGRNGTGPSAKWKDDAHFYGYCTEKDRAGYVPIAKPYGRLPNP